MAALPGVPGGTVDFGDVDLPTGHHQLVARIAGRAGGADTS